MKQKKITDLPFRTDSYVIALLQPETIIDLGRLSTGLMAQAFEDSVTKPRMIHVRTLQCDKRGPFALSESCGGRITLKNPSEIGVKHTGIVLACSNPECGLTVASDQYQTLPDLSNLLFHLMLKQMVPDLPTANFIDCNLKEEPLVRGELKDARALGLISVAADYLYGTVEKSLTAGQVRELSCGLGYMFTPGMDTQCDCDGYDAWLQFLVTKKFELLGDQHDALASMLLGPKPARNSR